MVPYLRWRPELTALRSAGRGCAFSAPWIEPPQSSGLLSTTAFLSWSSAGWSASGKEPREHLNIATTLDWPQHGIPCKPPSAWSTLVWRTIKVKATGSADLIYQHEGAADGLKVTTGLRQVSPLSSRLLMPGWTSAGAGAEAVWCETWRSFPPSFSPLLQLPPLFLCFSLVLKPTSSSFFTVFLFLLRVPCSSSCLSAGTKHPLIPDSRISL